MYANDNIDNFVVFPYINIVIFCRKLLALNPDSEFERRKYFSPLRDYFKQFAITIINLSPFK
jgi:hypothetical protein